MTDEIDYWKRFWGDKTDPLHSFNDKKYYSDYGKELLVLLPPNYNSVLELGCGSGSLYEPLNFDKLESYVGVDLSRSMLDVFRESYSDLSLFEGSADSYRDSNKYDLIFTNGVVQYLNPGMLRDQIQNALEMLNDNGLIVHSSIPWKVMKWQHAIGHLSSPYVYNGIKPVLHYLATNLGLKKDKMGYWYSVKEFYSLGHESNLIVRVYGSIYYPYRFHVTMKKA